MGLIEILYAVSNSPLDDERWSAYLHYLPKNIQERIQRYQRWQDRQATLFGKLLLREGLKRRGHHPARIHDLTWNSYGRPSLVGSIDFNISHAGDYVVCGIIDHGRIGIDLEQIRPIELTDFESSFTPQEWQRIQCATNKSRSFYECWTSKESLIKADGRGLSLSLSDITIDGPKVALSNTCWFLHRIDLNADYICHLATDMKNPTFFLTEVKF
ncbi:MAG: 4'-phosphopantetheinyl transferase superfamily protein [Deltaproteobacteria bacterium]|nr:4'-phosphopantetheinyl transferase superfamily protein [Deltaproteobacteria bacterium]